MISFTDSRLQMKCELWLLCGKENWVWCNSITFRCTLLITVYYTYQQLCTKCRAISYTQDWICCIQMYIHACRHCRGCRILKAALLCALSMCSGHAVRCSCNSMHSTAQGIPSTYVYICVCITFLLFFYVNFCLTFVKTMSMFRII